jgi:hypothetical protein
MSFVRVALLAGLAAACLSACGSQTAPPAGRGRIDNPRTAYSNHVDCLRQQNLALTAATINHLPGLRIGAAPGGPSVVFEPSTGTAQGAQTTGQAQAAEVIGSALLYPNQGSDQELTEIENCLGQGVTL